MIFTDVLPDEDNFLRDIGAERSPCLISVVGAGGKTSLIAWLAQHLTTTLSRRVVITTTTRMYLPLPPARLVFCCDCLTLPATMYLQPQIALFSGLDDETGKVRGFDVAVFPALMQRNEVDVVLVEADGSRGAPLKAPALHEPCIAAGSHCVIAVTGGQLLGQPAGADDVHRWPEFSAITGLRCGERPGWNHLLALARHPEGLFKSAPSGARRIWFINQVSHSEKNAALLLSPLLTEGVVDAIWLGAIQQNPAFHYRLAITRSDPRMDI